MTRSDTPAAYDPLLQDRGPMPDTHLDPLPLRLVELPGLQLEYLTTVLDRWFKTHNLVNSLTTKVVSVFMQYCSPANVCDVGLALAAEYLMWFFAIDDMPDGAEKLSALTEVRLVLQGHPAKDDGLLKATLELRSRVLQTFGEIETARLFHLLDLLLASFLWETERAADTPPVALYRENREHTIAVYPYIELFRLAERVQPSQTVWPLVCVLEKLCVEIIYLTNDILSVRRDLRKRTHNLVIGIARESNVTYEAAFLQVVSLLKHTTDKFIVAQNELLRTEALEDRTRKYVDYLGSILEGNRLATVILAERYLGNG